MVSPILVAVWGVRPDLEDRLRTLGIEPRAWTGGPLDDGVLALVVDVRQGSPPAVPDERTPALVVHEGPPPTWARLTVPAERIHEDLARALLAAVREGARARAIQQERETVADLLELVCHDLRNPLAAIRANLGLLEASPLDESSAEAVADSMMAADGALRIVENIAIASALEAGRRREGRGAADARAAVSEATRRTLPAADASAIAIVVDVPDGSVPCGCAPHALAALLDNLLAAALRYAPRGTEVRAGLECREESVRVTISEAGAPVPPDIAAVLFERSAQRASKATAEGRYGRGLGLYVAGLLASSCGAKLEAIAEDGRNGYRLDLPLEPPGDVTEAE